MKIINSNRIPTSLRMKIEQAFKSLIGKSNNVGSIIEVRVQEILENLTKKSLLSSFKNLKVAPDVYNVSFKYVPVLPQFETPAMPVWIEIKEDWHVYLFDIPETKSLSQALYEYFDTITSERWPPSYGFIRLECATCNNHTLYNNLQDIPEARNDQGTVDCPHCGTPWLTYSYRKNNEENND